MEVDVFIGTQSEKILEYRKSQRAGLSHHASFLAASVPWAVDSERDDLMVRSI